MSGQAQEIVDRIGEGSSWCGVGKPVPDAEMKALLAAHFEEVGPALERLGSFHCCTAHLDVADSSPARRFFEGGKS